MQISTLTGKVLLAAFLFFVCFSQAKATDLNAGDLLFTGYHSNASTTDAFSFVLLVNLSGTTTVSFTDNGWLSTNAFRVGEQTATWTYTGTLVAGREITISGPSAGAGIAILSGSGTTIGSVSGSIPSFATSGDQIIAYRGSVAAPTLIAGLHMNVYSTDLGQCANTTAAAWDPGCITDNANFSVMPLGLAQNVSTTWIGTEGVGASEHDNARFGCIGPLLTAAQVRASITNQANWLRNSVAPPAFVLPSRCAYLGLIGLSTSASTSVSGMAQTADGRALGQVSVTILDQEGNSRTAITSPLGYYSFEGLVVGKSYVITASSKTFSFSPLVFTLNNQLTGIDLIANP